MDSRSCFLFALVLILPATATAADSSFDRWIRGPMEGRSLFAAAASPTTTAAWSQAASLASTPPTTAAWSLAASVQSTSPTTATTGAFSSSAQSLSVPALELAAVLSDRKVVTVLARMTHRLGARMTAFETQRGSAGVTRYCLHFHVTDDDGGNRHDQVYVVTVDGGRGRPRVTGIEGPLSTTR